MRQENGAGDGLGTRIIDSHTHYTQWLTQCADSLAGAVHHLEGGLQSSGEHIHLTEVPVALLEK